MTESVLLVRETRAGETRVALTPNDVSALLLCGAVRRIYVERGAGLAAGFVDADFERAGAVLRASADDDSDAEGLARLFADVHTIVRCKRASPVRERAEVEALARARTVQRMVGALDVLERASSHVQAWKDAGVSEIVSLDQLASSKLLSAMSDMTGELAFRHALSLAGAQPVQRVVILGFGVAAKSALREAQTHAAVERVDVFCTQRQECDDARVHFTVMPATLAEQQAVVRAAVVSAQVVICAARRSNTPAPLLLPADTLEAMLPGAVVLDLAVTEGGNCDGALHDQTVVVGSKQVLVVNVSGYPKAHPHEASVRWSAASTEFFKSN
jgi:NAD(P) transhydrogenase subunit alpha